MKILKLGSLFFLVLVLAMGVRAATRKLVPGLYSAVWGGATVVEKHHQAEPIETVTKEEKKEQLTSTVPSSAQNEVYATGAVRRGRRVLVQLSDGTVRTDLDNEPGKVRLSKVTSTFADIDGKRYWFRASPTLGRGEVVAADRRPLDSASEPPSPNGRAPVDGGETPPVASGPSSGGSWSTGPDGVSRIRNPDTYVNR